MFKVFRSTKKTISFLFLLFSCLYSFSKNNKSYRKGSGDIEKKKLMAKGSSNIEKLSLEEKASLEFIGLLGHTFKIFSYFKMLSSSADFEKLGKEEQSEIKSRCGELEKILGKMQLVFSMGEEDENLFSIVTHDDIQYSYIKDFGKFINFFNNSNVLLVDFFRKFGIDLDVNFYSKFKSVCSLDSIILFLEKIKSDIGL